MMIAKIGIYDNCASEKPSKVYICHRLLFGISKKALALAQNAENKTAEEQEAVLVEMLQAIFPEFEAAELDLVDPAELAELIDKLQKSSNGEFERVAKN